jgi:hypothetical protein
VRVTTTGETVIGFDQRRRARKPPDVRPLRRFT